MNRADLPPDLVARIETLAYRLWSVHPRDIDPLPPESGWEGRGGQRAAYYAGQIADLVRELGSENAALRAEVARLNGRPPASPRPFQPAEDAEPGYAFWAVVGLRVEPESDTARAYVLEASPDCAARDIFINGPETGENGDDLAWTRSRPSGLYLIQMSPQGEEDDFDLNVFAVSPLCPLGDDRARTIAEHLEATEQTLVSERHARPPVGAPVRAGEAAGRYAGRRGQIEEIVYRVRLRSLTRDPERRGLLVTLTRDEIIPLSLDPPREGETASDRPADRTRPIPAPIPPIGEPR